MAYDLSPKTTKTGEITQEVPKGGEINKTLKKIIDEIEEEKVDRLPNEHQAIISHNNGFNQALTFAITIISKYLEENESK